MTTLHKLWLAAVVFTGACIQPSGAATAEPRPREAAAPEGSLEEQPWGWELKGRALTKFLGPASPNLAKWAIRPEIDDNIYGGLLKPPLSGHVTIMVSTSPMSHAPLPGGSDMVGVLRGQWRKWKHEGTQVAEFGFAGAGDDTVRININASSEADLDTVVGELSRLPMFNSTPDAPFRQIRFRKRLIQCVCWLLLPGLFIASVWLPDRYLRRRTSALWRTCVFGIVSALWLLLFVALVRMYPDRSFLSLSHPDLYLWLVPALATFCFIVSVVLATALAARRLFGKRARMRLDSSRT